MPNAVEFVLGGDKDSNDLGKLPAVATSGGNPATTLEIEIGTNLATWPTTYTVPDGAVANVPGVTVVKGSPSGFDTVTLTVPQSPDTRKFARLKVTISE